MDTKNINLLIIGELGETFEFLGVISVLSMQLLIKEAEKLQLSCLSGIDLYKDTYFNYLQTKNIITNELILLNKYSTLQDNLLKMIQRGAETVYREKGYTYLKFSGLSLKNIQNNYHS
ncbi:hypothetical protein KAH94_06375 [bacterium]|nr:hypothetical protein [bacterium]